MKKAILTLAVSLLMLATVFLVSAEIEGRIMKWTVSSSTDFTVYFCGSETEIEFTVATPSSTALQPDCQNNATSTPIMDITNDGNTNITLEVSLNATKPSWATVYVHNTTDFANAQTLDTTQVKIWEHLANETNASLYAWTTTVSAPAGTYVRNMTINSTATV